MTTPETHARLAVLQRERTIPTPPPLTGQTLIPIQPSGVPTVPTRIQRRRTAGWRKPANTVIVDRTSRFGNPFRITSAMDAFGCTETQAREYAVKTFGPWLAGSRAEWVSDEADRLRERILASLPQLVDKDLACACAPDEQCHADVLLEWAAAPDLAERVAKARARVDQQRTARGEDPLYGDSTAAA